MTISSALKHLAGPLLLLTWAIPAAAANRPVSSCGTVISEPGSYKVVQDIACTTPGRSAITIVASDVRLSLNHHTIQGNGLVTVGIEAFGGPLSNIRIHDHGTISGFTTGIFLFRTTRSQVSDLSLTGNLFGILLRLSDENRIRSLFVQNTDEGIVLAESHGNSVTDNELPGPQGVGIWLLGSNRNRIRSNNIRENQVGINLMSFEGEPSHENVINDNTSELNLVGISIDEGSSENSLRGNTALQNTIGDLIDRNLPACVNNWDDNTFQTDNEAGADAGPEGGCIQ